MKKIIFSITVFACFIALMASIVLPISAVSTETEPVEYDSTEAEQLDVTDSYYYDRITERQQWCYNHIKEYIDNFTGETGQHRYDWSHLLPAGSTEEDYYKLMDDITVAQMALCADHPMYSLKMGSFGYSCDTTDPQNFRLIVDIDHPHVLTDDVEAQANARIEQIVNTIGDGDRYTKLHKLAHYIISNTFYDPYLDQVNSYTNKYEEILLRFPNDLIDRGIEYDVSPYGVLIQNIAICDGYADVVKVLCDEMNIPCIQVHNVAHAWNLVQMENGEWYRFDMTNASPLGWDESPDVESFFEQTFLNNGGLNFSYDEPHYLYSIDNEFYITEYPTLAEGRYEYTGETTDFSYEVVSSTYIPKDPKFSYQVHKDGRTCRITNFEGKIDGDLVIPETIDGYTVTVIAPFAFYYRTDITGKVVIPDTVEEISYAAFAGCYNMTSIDLPKNLRELGKGAFIGCKSLTEIDLPDLLESVSEYVFYDCDKLTRVSFGTHIQFVEQNAFDRIDSTLLIQAPSGSVAHTLAQTNDITFEAKGTMCSFVDVDGEWEFYDFGHYHTCEHGARFDLGEHVNEQPFYSCGDICEVCEAHRCNTYGFIKEPSVFEWKRYEDLTFEGNNTVGHYKECICGNRYEAGAHEGGTATEDQRAICDICELEYGEFLHVHKNFEWFDIGGGHHKVCVDCYESMGEIEPHYGGTATEYEPATCEVCGYFYGDLLPHTTHVCSYWVYASEEVHYQICDICYIQFNEGPHQGGVATETQRAICELCDGAYGDYAPHVSISTGSDEYGHFDVCACGEIFNFESHYGGTASDDELPICVVCGTAYGHIHTPIANDCNQYGHYQICGCGEQLNFEAHYGGTATEYELALCEVCGVAYGNLAAHVHNGGNGFACDEFCHYELCTCGEVVDFEPHWGGTATEDELALCSVCGVAYGDFAEHVHSAAWQESNEYNHYWVCSCGEQLNIEAHYGGTATETQRAVCVVCGVEYGDYLSDTDHVHDDLTMVATEGFHYQVCSCGVWLGEERHYGGTATATQRAICEVCGVEYGDYASNSSENNTEAPENNTEAPENNTEAPENNTEALENNTKEPDSTNSATNAIVGGCGSSVGMGLISLVATFATGYVVLKKKKDN